MKDGRDGRELNISSPAHNCILYTCHGPVCSCHGPVCKVPRVAVPADICACSDTFQTYMINRQNFWQAKRMWILHQDSSWGPELIPHIEVYVHPCGPASDNIDCCSYQQTLRHRHTADSQRPGASDAHWTCFTTPQPTPVAATLKFSIILCLM